MNHLLWISVVFCLIATGACQSSELLLSTVDANWNFTIAVDSSGHVSFTRNSSPYAVLHNLACSVGQYPQWNGTAWACGTNVSLTSDSLGAIASSCYSTSPQGVLQNVPVYGTTSFSGCSGDSNSLASLSCSSGQIPSRDAGGSICVSDSDLAAAALASCSGSATPKFASNGTFACGLNLTDVDTARDLLSSCTDGQLARYNGSAWICDDDYNLLSAGVCSDGQIVLAGATSWTCGTDADVLGQLSTSCTGSLDTPQYTSSGGWICVASPVISLSAPVAETMVTATYTVTAGSWTPSSSSFTGISGIPYYLTSNTIVKAWTLRNLLSTPANITASLWAGTTAVSNLTLSSFTLYHQTVVASAVTPGLVGVQLYNSGSSSASITIDIFVEISLA